MRHYWSRLGLAALLLQSSSVWAQLVVFTPLKTAAYASTATVMTLAGLANQKGSTDAVGTAARFAYPMGIAIAPDGTLYVADEGNQTIRKITPAGEVTTLAGLAGSAGSTDGPGPAARFNHPVGLALGAGGTLYVTDSDNQTIRKVTPAGQVTTLAGTVGRKGSADGAGPAARFNVPQGIAADTRGNIYVADTENHTIRKIAPDGTVTTLAGAVRHKGTTDGVGLAARFFHPAGMAVDTSGVLYVADNGNHTIRRITPHGQVSTLAGQAGHHGGTDGPGSQARFLFPVGVAVDAINNVYVADHLNVTVRKISPTGEVSTLAGSVLRVGQTDGPGPEARFVGPLFIAVDANGALYLTDGLTVRLVKWNK